MAHPHADLRQSKVEHKRVGALTKGYATGGSVHDDAPADRKLVRKQVKPSALKVEGAMARARADRPNRAKGGRVKKGGTTVNVIVAPKDVDVAAPPMGLAGGPPPMPKPMPAPPASAPVMAGPPPGVGPMPPPGMGGPPGMLPPRKHGGRTYATGGAVKSGPAYEEGRRNGTQVQHDIGKNDLQELHRGKPITYAKGGPVEAPKGNAGMGPKLPGGGRGGLARLAKARRAAG